jgi:5-oxoprolinase (ATP-hydrolysing) subunit A
MITVDLNADVGESFGAYTIGNDGALMPHITSANIACGFHAGDFTTMNQTVALANQHNVAIGAHPALPDLQGFGRREMKVTPREVYSMCQYQIGALHGIVKGHQTKLHHVKPHGALYNMAAVDRALADAIAQAIQDFDSSLILYGLANSALIDAARQLGLRFKQEVFADRTYQDNGTLTPRSQPNALVKDLHSSIAQVKQMVLNKSVISIHGLPVVIAADTVCIHGDSQHAVEFASALRKMLLGEQVSITSAQG